MVGVARIELATPAMSTQCSTTELYAHADGPLAALTTLSKLSEAGALKNPVDLHHEVAQVERLAEHAAVRHGLAGP